MRRKYDAKILNKIEKSLDVILPLAAIIAFTVAFLYGKTDKNQIFVILDSVLGLGFFGVFLLRKKFNVKFKIVLVSLATFFMGVYSLLNTGFMGTGIMLLVLSALVMVSFLPFKQGLAFAVLTLCTLIAVGVFASTGWITYTGYNAFILAQPVDWMIHVIVYVMYVVALVVIVNAIKNYLINSINEAESSVEKIRDLAYMDQLTGIPNKYKFIEMLNETRPTEGWVVLFSIRGLNLINSIYGNEVGDQVIRSIGNHLTLNSSEGEVVAKTGGNEFVWYTITSGFDEMIERVDSLINLIHSDHEMTGLPTNIQLNSGFVQVEQAFEDAAVLLQKASIALEQAKYNKNKKPILYDHQLEARFRKDETIKSLIIKAVDNKEFYISYQEKFDRHLNKVVGLEALARWNSSSLGVVSPAQFIPIVEKSNFSIPFGEMIVKLVFSEYARLKARYDHPVSISINISPIHITSQEFPDFMIEQAERYEVDPNLVILEITEDSLIEDWEGVSSVLFRLRGMGFKISLDDFGTGYSSLSYLARLGFDELKIDRSFIQLLEGDEKTSTLIKAIINLKETYGIDIVAEGVETTNQSDSLIKLGCNVHQGYLFSKPEPLNK